MCLFPAPPDRQRSRRGRYRARGSKFISVQQATNIIEAVAFAKSLDRPLVAHLTIHWSGSDAFDDHDGTRFAKTREGLSKVLLRRGIPVAWVWCRECKAVKLKNGPILTASISSRAVAPKCGRKKFRELQGIIHGKRCGVSQNLGPTARFRALIKQRETTRSAQPTDYPKRLATQKRHAACAHHRQPNA